MTFLNLEKEQQKSNNVTCTIYVPCNLEVSGIFFSSDSRDPLHTEFKERFSCPRSQE